jgi:hypothetical protein
LRRRRVLEDIHSYWDYDLYVKHSGADVGAGEVPAIDEPTDPEPPNLFSFVIPVLKRAVHTFSKRISEKINQ